MIFADLNIDYNIISFFKKNSNYLPDFRKANLFLNRICGIRNFFDSQEEANELIVLLEDYILNLEDSDRREYGDFQTNERLAKEVTHFISLNNSDIEFILEPTCGKGSFIIACLKQFKSIKKIIGVEIHHPYVWETKFNLLNYFVENSNSIIPDIEIVQANVFNYSFGKLAEETKGLKTLIIGNPPWVTNSELGSISSNNLPQKSNFKKNKGFDALTGKGNFDIGESISLLMLNNFQHHQGVFAFLIKNSVIKNIIQEQRNNNFKISELKKLIIDSKKEFNVSVHASLFYTSLNKKRDYTCDEFDFYSQKKITTFGWYKEKFVNSIDAYTQAGFIDGKSCFTWRSGIKHDCAKIMELERVNGHFKNGYDQLISLEENLVFGLLKSSDLKGEEINTSRKSTIITQKKIGQETRYIQNKHPLTFNYLKKNIEFFERRKSSIYIGKPSFSIFGIGDYSFLPYKIGISGLYKTTYFTLITSDNDKPLMLDDTCYFIGFENIKFAQIAHYLVNSKIAQDFLKSIIFSDSKRSINKDILMRLDFGKIYDNSNFDVLKKSHRNISEKDWIEFGKLIYKGKTVDKQISLF